MDQAQTGLHIETTWREGRDLNLLETLYHTANGYVGVRNAPEEGHVEGSIRGTYLNGFYENVDIRYDEKLYGFPESKQVLVNVPDAQTVRVEAGDEAFEMFSPAVSERRQELDMELGMAVRSALWRAAGGGLRLKVERMASFVRRNLFVMRISVTSEGYAGPLRFVSVINGAVCNHAAADDPRVASEPLRCLRTLKAGWEGEEACLLSETLRSGLGVVCRARHQCALAYSLHANAERLTAVFEGTIARGESVQLVKYVAYTDSLRMEDWRQAGSRLLGQACIAGFEAMAQEQARWLLAWRKQSLITFYGSEKLSRALGYDLYQLLQSTGTDGSASVAAKGISGEGYEGHVFWDCETYVFPFFLWTQPEAAKGILLYRCGLLEAARKNARRLGIEKGALFPWRTISGTECSSYFPAGAAQYHINGDIAYAFIQYWYVTRDVDFMAEKGAAVLVETARMWLELGYMAEEGFRIDCVTGPDEYTCLVNNNFYTNAAARYNLKGAAAMVRTLARLGKDGCVRAATGVTEEELCSFEEAARRMMLPYDERLGISAQDDSFLHKKPLDWKQLASTQFPLLLHYHPLFLYRHQVCKQADTVLAHLLFPDTAAPEVISRSYEYYNRVTTHDSSLSLCVFAMMAARLGRQEASDGFARTIALDLEDTHGNTRDGLHTASMGGAYLAMLKGFGGIEAEGETLRAAPFLPDSWEGYEIPFCYRGRRLLLNMTREGGAKLRLLSGEALCVRWYGQEMRLEVSGNGC